VLAHADASQHRLVDPRSGIADQRGSAPWWLSPALGAFVVAGLLTVAAGRSSHFERAIASIPSALASALLAGVLLPVCLAPAHAAVALPGLAAPVILTWLVLLRAARRLASLGALLAAAIALVVDGRLGAGTLHHAQPTLTATLPRFDLGTIASIGLPLFLVTMASQNLAGISVLALHGYRPRLRPILTSTGAVSIAIAPVGAHAINLAAITAALMAGPDAGPRPERRWIAGAAGGATLLALGPVAGLALLSALSGALTAAMADRGHRDAALVTFITTASGITALGLSAPVWGLVAGLVMLAVQRRSHSPPEPA
jgi:benzoate membrane transport protein